MKLDLRNKEWIKGDKILWYVIIGLMIASIMVVYSSTGRFGERESGLFSGEAGRDYFGLPVVDLLVAICAV